MTNRLDDTVSVIDVAARKVVATLKAGNEPHGVLTDRAGKLLYVLNTSSNDISVFDLASSETGQEPQRGQWTLVAGAVAGRRSEFSPPT